MVTKINPAIIREIQDYADQFCLLKNVYDPTVWWQNLFARTISKPEYQSLIDSQIGSEVIKLNHERYLRDLNLAWGFEIENIFVIRRDEKVTLITRTRLMGDIEFEIEGNSYFLNSSGNKLATSQLIFATLVSFILFLNESEQ